MSWIMAGKPSVLKATPQLVERFAKMTPAPGDRRLNERRAARVRHLMLTGEFRTCEWAQAYCAEDGNTYRVNGKHTSTMLSQMNGNAPRDLWVIVEEYHCDTLNDVAQLYATFDSKDGVRTVGDINRSFAGSHAALKDVPGSIINVAVSAISYESLEDGYTAVRPEERAAKMAEEGDFICWLQNLITGHDSRHIRRIPVVAGMFRSYKKCQRDALAFWSAVRDGSGPDHHSPDRKLAKYLMMTCVGTGRGASTGKSLAGNREMYVKSIHAWNAWRRGGGTDLKYYSEKDTPKAV